MGILSLFWGEISTWDYGNGLTISVRFTGSRYEMVVFLGKKTLHEATKDTRFDAHQAGRQWLIDEEWIDG